MAIAFNLDPIMTVRLMFSASYLDGPNSSLITQVCKGNTVLLVTLTAIMSIIPIPFILMYALEFFGGGADVAIKLPILDTILQIMIITVISISIEILIHSYKRDFAKSMEKLTEQKKTTRF